MKIEILQCGSYTSATVTDGGQTTEYRSEVGVIWVTQDGTRPSRALESKLDDAVRADHLWGPHAIG